jgi:ABC-type lipoprotein export system ATPase subunit
MVTHDPAIAADADRIVHMRDGRMDIDGLVGASAHAGRTI